MNKYIIGAVVLGALLIGNVAIAAKVATLPVVWLGEVKDASLYKVQDGKATCYVLKFGQSGYDLDCVK